VSHAKLSPSSRYRWQLCPGSVRECERYEGGGKSSPAAIDGTHSHTLLEHCVRRGEPDASTFIGNTLSDHEGEFIVEMDRCDRVQIALDYIEERLVHYGDGPLLASEVKVDPAPLLGRDDCFGTVDVHIRCGRFLEVIDYKDGMNEVEAKDNPQLQQYTIGLLAKYIGEDGLLPFDTIRMTIIQPKLAKIGRPPVSFWEYTENEVSDMYVALIQDAAATDDPEAPLVPGEKQCKYCPHAGNCSALMEHTMAAAGITFKDMSAAKEAATVDPSSLSDDRLREMVEAAPMIRKMLDAVEAEALSRIEAGHEVKGLKVVRGVGRRCWLLPDEDVAAKLTRMGVPKGEIWKTSIITPATLEKLRWTKRDGTEKQLSPKQLETAAKEMISKSDGKLTVVPAADRRPAVEFTKIETMFVSVDALPSWLS